VIREYTQRILEEIQYILETLDEQQVNQLADIILNARYIVVSGAGRVGLACQGFAMRLSHLGKQAFTLGDSTVPAIGKGDLLLVCSGSGETQTIYDIALSGKNSGAYLALITARPDSRIGRLADFNVYVRAPSKVQPLDNFASIQPMTTLNEQCLQIFFDALVLVLMEKSGQCNQDLWQRHSILE